MMAKKYNFVIMKFYLLFFLLIFANGCAIKYKNIKPIDNSPKVTKLQKLLTSLSPTIDKNEAHDLAVFANYYTKKLANEYDLVGSPNFQNFLINIGLKKKGYCYNYAFDLADALKKRGYKTIDFYWISHKKGTIFEHNAVLATPKEYNTNGVILDGWRNAGELYFSLLKNDKEYQGWKLISQF